MGSKAVASRAELHGLLFGLAGRVPDDGMAMLRTFLAEGDEPALSTMFAQAIEAGRLPLTGAQADLIGALLARNGLASDPWAAGPAPAPQLTVRFTAQPERSGLGGGGEDDGLAEQIAIEAVGRMGGVLTLWRAWRSPAPNVASHGGSSARVAKVFLVEAEAGTDLAEVTAELQQWLAEVGEDPPRVEVFDADLALPPYQRCALAAAQRLWTVEIPVSPCQEPEDHD